MRTLKSEHYILLNALKDTDRSSEVLYYFNSTYNPVVRMLESFSELKMQGMVDSRDKGDYVSWTLTEKGKSLL